MPRNFVYYFVTQVMSDQLIKKYKVECVVDTARMTRGFKFRVIKQNSIMKQEIRVHALAENLFSTCLVMIE